MFPEGKSGAETAEDFSTPGTPPDNPLTMSTEVGCPSTVGGGRIPQTHTSPNKNYLGGEDYQDSALDPSRQGSYKDGQWEDAEATYMDITIKSTSTSEIISKINYNGDYYGKINCKRVTGNRTGSTKRRNVEIKC